MLGFQVVLDVTGDGLRMEAPDPPQPVFVTPPLTPEEGVVLARNLRAYAGPSSPTKSHEGKGGPDESPYGITHPTRTQMSKHKPVQWVVDKGGIYAVTAGQLTAVVNWPVFHEPEAADAALICAAPDLLAVLEEMELAHTMSDEPVLSRHHLSLIRAAIKKARGAK